MRFSSRTGLECFINSKVHYISLGFVFCKVYQLHDVVFDTIVQLPLSHFSVADPEQEPLSDMVTELPDGVLG